MSLSSDRADVLQLANGLRPTLLEERWHAWRRLSMPGSAGERVSQSYGYPIPVSGLSGLAGDKLDQRINAAEKAFAGALGEARRQLDLALAIQQGWLTPIHVASKEERAQASDLGIDCRKCLRPVACTPADRLRAGFCEECYRWWLRNDRPEMAPADAKSYDTAFPTSA